MNIGKHSGKMNLGSIRNTMDTTNILRNLNFDRNQFITSWNSAGVNITLVEKPVKTFFAVCSHTTIGMNTTDVQLGPTYLPFPSPYICDNFYQHTMGNPIVKIKEAGNYIIQARFELELYDTNVQTSIDARFRYQLYSNVTALYEGVDICFLYPEISGHTYPSFANRTYRNGTITSVINVADDLDDGQFNIKAIPSNFSGDGFDIIPQASNILIRGPI